MLILVKLNNMHEGFFFNPICLRKIVNIESQFGLHQGLNFTSSPSNEKKVVAINQMIERLNDLTSAEEEGCISFARGLRKCGTMPFGAN